ncbi:hypothetical protein RCL_jg6538.t1 [Rhizophagus clarus]|uniref:Uncharacterized protein n=1 Tax=Rhizophagus clarus TaxID=94130 RepID=A0A8H3LE97_9GLOM|nr:hypothetical protein RCL_jg6538.t1 [Rhizophagus clarus]
MENKKVFDEDAEESHEMDIIEEYKNEGYQEYSFLMSVIELDDDEKIDASYFIGNLNFQLLTAEEKIAFVDAVNKRLGVIKRERMIKGWIEGFAETLRERIEADVREKMKKKVL